MLVLKHCVLQIGSRFDRFTRETYTARVPVRLRCVCDGKKGDDMAESSGSRAGDGDTAKVRRRNRRERTMDAPRESPTLDTQTQPSTSSPSPEAPAVAHPPQRRGKSERVRRAVSARARGRESNVTGLAERARLFTEQHSVLPLADPFFRALPGIRQTILNDQFDQAVREAAQRIASALVPAVAQVWIADLAPWTGEHERAGGLEVAPTLRLRAMARAEASAADGEQEATRGELSASGHYQRSGARPDELVSEVAAARRPVVLLDCAHHPLASEWQWMVPETATPAGTPSALGALVAYPLRARGQFLGVIAVGTRNRLSARHLNALEELADLLALAADRDRLLSYSRSQEALAQTVIRHAPVAVAVLTGPDHVFALVNPTFALLLGLEHEEDITGKSLRDVLQRRNQSLEESLRLDAVYATGEPQAMIELPVHLERGMTYWNVTSSPLPGFASGVAGVLVAAVDMTRQVMARRRALETAEVAQERIGQMMTLHATALTVASQLGADPRELLQDILGRSISLLEARAGTVYARRSHRDELEVMVCQGLRGDYTGARIRIGEGLAGRVAQTGRGLIVDDYRAYPFRAAIYDNEDFSAVIAVPLIHRGQVVGVLDVLDDADQRTFTDDDLWLLDLFAAQAAQAIENARTYLELEHAYRQQRELDRMKDDFIATASHELRTPLTGVQGFLDLLREFPGSRDEPLALEFLERASDSAQELAEIAERLLQTSRLDTGRVELHLERVQLSAVVEDVLRSHRELARVRSQTHDLTMEVPSDVYVQADPGRLREVIDNLVGNAIKYSPKGGTITVACGLASFPVSAQDEIVTTGQREPVEESPTMVLPQVLDVPHGSEEDATRPASTVMLASQERPYYEIRVRDEGMGIPEDERGHLFGRFARLESARVSQIRGTGLGLYICRQMMRAMGGDVWLKESVPERGSVFALAVAAATAVEAAPEGAALVTAPAAMAGRD